MAARIGETGPARANLRLFAWLRAIAVTGQAATVLATYWILGIPVPLAPLLGASAVLALVDAATFVRLRQPWPVADAELFGQILVDVAVLTVLLYFSGGTINPFASCYLLLVMYAAGALPRRQVWIVMAVCVFCYTALRIYYVPLPLPPSIALEHELMYSAQWVNQTLLAALVAWFGVRINDIWLQHHRLRRAEAEKDAHERSLIGLAALAAGTAHEMSTPLSTMSVVLGDLRHSSAPPPDWKRSVELLWQQIQTCKRSLSDMLNAADIEKIGQAQNVPVKRFIQNLAERFQLLRPQIALDLRCAEIDDALAIKSDPTLVQSLLSLINNAADASPHAVALHAWQKDLVLVIRILDRGPGIAPQLRERLGRGPVTKSGHGVGVFIANAAIERLGGIVQMFDREDGGTCVQVDLPGFLAGQSNASEAANTQT